MHSMHIPDLLPESSHSRAEHVIPDESEEDTYGHAGQAAGLANGSAR